MCAIAQRVYDEAQRTLKVKKSLIHEQTGHHEVDMAYENDADIATRKVCGTIFLNAHHKVEKATNRYYAKLLMNYLTRDRHKNSSLMQMYVLFAKIQT